MSGLLKKFGAPILLALWTGMQTFGAPAGKADVIVDEKVAQFVANQHVHSNNRPFQWHVVDHMVLHGIDGSVQAYAFIFAKAESRFHSPEDLRTHIQSESANAFVAQDISASGSNSSSMVNNLANLYRFDDLATVITGANTESPVILRHFRGLPEFWVEKESMGSAASTQRYGRAYRAISILMLTPMDFRIALQEGAGGGPRTAVLREAEVVAIPDSARVLVLHSKQLENLGALRKAHQEGEARRTKRLERMEPGNRQKYETGLRERSNAIAAEWMSHREQWQKAQRGSEVAR